MVQGFVAAVGVLVLIAMSVWANRRFGNENRLPMQWSVAGTVNWTAPRRFALAFTPTLATVVLAAVVASSLLVEPRRGQEGVEVPTILLIALMFVAAHALHLRLVEKSLHRNDR